MSTSVTATAPDQEVLDDTVYRRQLWQPRFIALLFTQFFTAINDNLFRWLVVPIGQHVLGSNQALAWGAILFTLPYLLFAPLAGYLADRFSKRSVIITFKVVEILVMALGSLAIWYGNVPLLLALIFLMGTQSALFSPAKIGAIPEMLSVRALSEGNGLMAMVTITACAIGMPIGLWIYDYAYDPSANLVTFWPIPVALLGIAVLGLIVSLFVRTGPAADSERAWSINPVAELKPSLQRLFEDRPLARAAVGIAYFYFLALLYQVNIDAFGGETLGMDKGEIAGLMPMLVIGIGVGSLLAGWMSGGVIQLGMVPIGAMGIAFSTMVLGLIGWSVDPESASSVTAAFRSSAVWLFILGAIGAFFYIPLETFLQHRSPLNIRGSILSASNALTNGFMLLSMGMFAFLRDGLSMSPAMVFVISGLLTLPVIVAAVAMYAVEMCRFLMRCLFNLMYSVHLHGFDKLPKEGGALLVPNHVSWLDGPMLCSFLPRNARFMIYANYTRKPILKWFAAIFRVIPLSPTEGPKAIMGALKDARRSATNGEFACIFPEGGISRSGRLITFNKGVLKIVQGTDTPIYPIHLHGLWGSKLSYRGGLFKSPFRWRRRVDFYIGDPHRDVNDVGTLHRAIEELSAHSMRDQMLKRPILLRQMVKQSKQAKFRMKSADSGGTEMTGGKLLAGSIAFSRMMKREVLDKNCDHVGVLAPPCAAGVLSNVALGFAGKVTVNLNYTLDDRVINYCIKDAGIRQVLTSRRFMEKKPIQADAELLYLEDLKEKVTTADRLIAAFLAYVVPAAIVERMLGLHKIDRHSSKTIVYTSGSTGVPKGVVLSHHNVLSNVEAVNYMFALGKDDVMIGVLPFFHSFGYTISLWLVMASPPAAAYHFNPLDARQVGKLAEKYKGSILLATPTFLRGYLKRVTPEQFKHLWLIVVGAEKLPIDLCEQWVETFKVPPIEGYGTTELSPLVAVNQPSFRDSHAVQDLNRLGTIGQCVPGVFAKIVDPETHEELPLGEEGLLFVSGPNLMRGYLNLQEKTDEVIHDGWYNTGDRGKIDADGFITLTGRQSRFSKIAGEMVPHIRVEEALASVVDKLDPQQIDEDSAPGSDLRVVVTAVPCEKRGEKLIVLHKPLSCSQQDVVRALQRSDLPNLWLPAADCFFEVDEIPLLGTGKLDLKAIKELAEDCCNPVSGAKEN